MQKEDVGAEVDLRVGRHPDLTIHKLLLQNNISSLLHGSQQATTHLYGIKEACLQTNDLPGLFINPNRSPQGL